MNSNLNRALAAAMVAFGAAGAASAQVYGDYDYLCFDPNNTAPYSVPFLYQYQYTELFGAAIGVGGTAAYSAPPTSIENCDSGSAIPGRIGFTLGYIGSIQDEDPNQDFGGVHDDRLRLTFGTNFNETTGPDVGAAYLGSYRTPASGGNSYARIYVNDGTATTSYLFGSNTFTLSFRGRSGRYCYVEGPVDGTASNNSINVRCIIDVLADAARVHWTMTNNLSPAKTVGIGLWFGQVVALTDETGRQWLNLFGAGGQEAFTDYITVPGRKPLTVDERFPGDVSTTVPAYADFSMSQRLGFGLQVVNNPSTLAQFDPVGAANGTIDQTPVDEWVIGSPPFLLDGHFNTADPQFGDFLFNAPGNGNADAAALTGYHGFPGYVQKWQPTQQVPQGSSRDIITYYRSTNFDSSYSPTFDGYAVAVDTPKAISTNAGALQTDNPFLANPFTIRVNVDNTGGFSNVDTSVSMQNIAVTLNLPEGMHAPGSTARTITKTVTRQYDALYSLENGTTPSAGKATTSIAPAQIGFVDFTVQVDAGTFGALPYTVTVTPTPGFATKTVTGTINVAATPNLTIRQGANLVSPPWKFSDASWETILGLGLNTDFQSYTWDAQLQQYVTQTSAQRGIGTFVVAANDYGYRTLQGAPQQPDDEFPDPNNYDVSDNGGAPIVRIRRGWNLVGNPYNYAFPLGQLVGIPTNTAQALTFEQLVANGYTDGAFAYYDPALKGYSFVPGDVASRLQPNFGYWLYANTDFELQFPPLYELFIRSAPTQTFKQRFDNWKLQLAATTTTSSDTQTYMGITNNTSSPLAANVRKAPMAPQVANLGGNSVRASVASASGVAMTQVMRSARGAQKFTYSVYTQKPGPVAITWPNLREVPSNLAVTLTDPVAHRTVDLRKTTSYTFSSAALSNRALQISVTPTATAAVRVGTISTAVVNTNPMRKMRVTYSGSVRGTATVTIMARNRQIATIAKDVDAIAGTNSVLWSMTGDDGMALPNGTYTLIVTLTGENGVSNARTQTIYVRH